MEFFIYLKVSSTVRLSNEKWLMEFECASPVGEDDTIESIADYFFDAICGDFNYDPETGKRDFMTICEPVKSGSYTLPLYPWYLNEELCLK